MFVYLTAPQSIPREVLTKVEFDTVGFDKNGEWDNENFRWVCKKAGTYGAHAFLAMTMGEQGANLQVRIHRNADEVALGYGHQNFNACAWPKCSLLLEFAVGDYLEVWAYRQNSKSSNLELCTANPISHNGFCIWAES